MKQNKQNTSKLKIIPLGGLEQIGMNITAFEYEDSIVVVDCGLSFPADDMLGVDTGCHLSEKQSGQSKGLCHHAWA